MTMHDDQIEIPVDVVRTLLDSQFPQLRDAPVDAGESLGTVNAIFRVGEDLAARFPLRSRDCAIERSVLEAQAHAADAFAAVSPFPSPRPVALGRPGDDYPGWWAIQTWLPGHSADGADVADSDGLAVDLVWLIRALRSADTAGRSFPGGRRGGHLREHDDWVRSCLGKSHPWLDVPRLTVLWDRFVGLPRSGPDVMSHGDLIPGNLLVADGHLVGVLDCGGFGPADPALDLIVAWHLFDDERRAVFRNGLQVDDLEWERAKAWAFEQSIGLVWYYVDTNPPLHAMGRSTLQRIVADAGW